MTTIETIARLAGVSPATVSKVLNNKPYVSPEARARIEQAIAATGYVPSHRARGLVTQRSSILGLLVPYTPDELFVDPHLVECMRGIETETNARAYHLLLSTMHTPSEAVASCMRLLQTAVIDGAIMLEALDLQPFTPFFAQTDKPIVLIGYAQNQPISEVHGDDYAGAQRAIAHLLALGHRRIGVVRSSLHLVALDKRLRGVVDALAAQGLTLDPACVQAADLSTESGEQAAHLLLDQPAPPTAIFALNDLMAFGVLRAAADRGLRVPDDLSVVGFDDVPLADLVTPRLTTVRQPGALLGRAAATMLFALLNGTATAPSVVVPTELVVRRSTGAPLPRS